MSLDEYRAIKTGNFLLDLYNQRHIPEDSVPFIRSLDEIYTGKKAYSRPNQSLKGMYRFLKLLTNKNSMSV